MSDEEKARRGTLKVTRVKKPAAEEPSSDLTDLADLLEPAGPVRDYVGLASKYAADVLSGAQVACRWVRMAVDRQVRDRLRASSDPSWPYVWSEVHVTQVCRFVESLPHVEGKWETPTIRLEPAQIFILACLFGWRQRQDVALRRFTLFYLEMGRKGAKSTLMAAISLFHLLEEDEPGATVVCGATTGQQARIVFGIMQKMITKSRWLRSRGLTAFANAIITSDGVAKPINAKASTQDGLNPSCIVLDESHAQTFELHDVLKSAQGARPNPLMLCPTTAGYNVLSVGYALRTTLTKVLERIYEADHFFGLIYTLDEGDDWRDPKAWAKSNPMLGVTPTLKWVRDYCSDAQQTPGTEGEFRVKVCSEWGQSTTAWLSLTRWDACKDESLRIERFLGKPCWIGCDLAQIDDLAAVALVFEEGGIEYGFVRFYLPEGVVDDRARAVPAYRGWADSGILIPTTGDMIDYARIEKDLRADCQRFKVQEIVFDQFGSVQISGNLVNDGIAAIVESKNPKTFTLPMRELQQRVRHGKFRHDGNQALRWMVSNVVVSKRTDDSLLPKKDHPESPNKIDGVDALCSATGSWLRHATKIEPAFQIMVVGRQGLQTMGVGR